jgi:hypothetical protein
MRRESGGATIGAKHHINPHSIEDVCSGPNPVVCSSASVRLTDGGQFLTRFSVPP